MSSLRSQMSTAPASGCRACTYSMPSGSASATTTSSARFALAGAHHRWANWATAMSPSSATVSVASSSGSIQLPHDRQRSCLLAAQHRLHVGSQVEALGHGRRPLGRGRRPIDYGPATAKKPPEYLSLWRRDFSYVRNRETFPRHAGRAHLASTPAVIAWWDVTGLTSGSRPRRRSSHLE